MTPATTTCGLCGQTLGRVRIYDHLRERFFCSERCALRYVVILDLWQNIRTRRR